jgi:hypothetical protein
MKMTINIEIECTPQEYREAMGLPDVQPIQKKMMELMEERIEENSVLTDPLKFFKTTTNGPTNFYGAMVDLWTMGLKKKTTQGD